MAAKTMTVTAGEWAMWLSQCAAHGITVSQEIARDPARWQTATQCWQVRAGSRGRMWAIPTHDAGAEDHRAGEIIEVASVAGGVARIISYRITDEMRCGSREICAVSTDGGAYPVVEEGGNSNG